MSVHIDFLVNGVLVARETSTIVYKGISEFELNLIYIINFEVLERNMQFVLIKVDLVGLVIYAIYLVVINRVAVKVEEQI